MNYGSLYTVIEQLQRERFIVASATRRESKKGSDSIFPVMCIARRPWNNTRSAINHRLVIRKNEASE